MDSLPLGPPEDDLGGSLYWAFGALRANAWQLVWVSLAAIGISLVGFVGALLIVSLAIELELASVTVVSWIVASAVVVAVIAWSAMTFARAWSMAVRGARVAVLEALSVERYPTFLATTIIVAPVTLFTAWLGFGFAATALLLVAGDGLSVGAALGRTLTETCRSARRFLHTVLIGLGVMLGQVTIFLVAWTLWWQVLGGTTTAQFSAAFSGSSNAARDAEANVTLTLGSLFALVLLAVGTAVVANLSGLWAAAHLRRLTGRPVGVRVTDHSQLNEGAQ